jgi:flagellar biogenesis protein FliO
VISLDEFLELPRPGWPGRRRAIARELAKMLGELLVFLAFIAVVLAWVVIAWASTPAPQ